jgi:flagellar biosynthesis protein FlhB
MEKMFNYATNFFKGMTSLFLVILSFGVMAEIVFGGAVFNISVIANIMDVINLLGESGFVGLITMLILFKFLDQE